MHTNWKRSAILTVTLAATAAATAAAQARAVKAISQTDVSLSLYGAFSGSTSGDGFAESPSNAAGGMIALRHIDNPLFGYEATYSFNRANQVYAPLACPATGITPGCDPAQPVSANAHEIAGNWVVSLKLANIRPFALAGVGLLFNQPASGQANTTSSDKGVFVYGIGLDWGLAPHLGLRLQYRGNVYKAPDLSTVFGSSTQFEHTGEPMIGAYLRF
jgi:opacity protein-like surface antigen